MKSNFGKYKKSKFAFGLFFVFQFLNVPARSQTMPASSIPGGAGASQNQFQDFQQRKMQLDLLAPPGSDLPQEERPVLNRPGVQKCFPVKHIDIKGDTILIRSDIRKIIEVYQNKCLSVADVNALVKYLNGAFISRGYITSRAYLPDQRLSSGRLTIVLVEGRIGALKIIGRPPRLLGEMAFPDIKGQTLNLHALEQGIENISRLPHSSAKIRIEPGAQPGLSDVVVSSPKTRVLHGQVWVDNYSQKITGRQMGHALLTAENPLGMTDLWSVEYDHSLMGNAGQRGTSFLMASGAIPFGYWTVFGSWWRSQDNYPLPVWSDVFTVRGLRNDWIIGASRVVARNSLGVTTLQASFEQKSFGSKLEDETIEVTRGRQAYVNVQASESLRAWHALWYATIGTKIAFDGAGTWSYFRAPASTEPHTSFLRPSIDIDGYKPLPEHILWHTTLHAEYSTRYQFPINQLQIGGPYTVRGFLQNILLGNQGLYMRNDFSWQLPLQQAGCPVSSWACRTILDHVEVYAALDFGIVRAGFTTPSMSPYQKGGEMLGAGLGLRKTSGPFFWDVALTHSLHTSPLPSEGLISLFQIGIKS